MGKNNERIKVINGQNPWEIKCFGGIYIRMIFIRASKGKTLKIRAVNEEV